MRTKDLQRRETLLDTAERIFIQQGFESVSITDLMAAMGLSKGGFYHHFSSKEEVLAALCERHAARACADLAELPADPVAAIEAVLHAFIPLRLEMADFVKTLLPVLHKPGSRLIALTYQDALMASFIPALESAVDHDQRGGYIFPEKRGMERPALHLANLCWMDAAPALLTDPTAALPQLEATRRAIELLLGMPFGSAEIVRLEELIALHDLIAAE